MRKILLAAIATVALGSASASADTDIVIKPEVDTWVITQPDTSVDFSGDVVIGTALPDNVVFVDVPDQPDVAYVVVNKKRVLVNKKTRKVIKVYN